MEILLTQKINFARIELFKNYSLLEEASDIIGNAKYGKKSHYGSHLISMRPVSINKGYTKKKTSYFQKNANIPDIAFFRRVGNVPFYTQKDRQIKRHYSNPFAEIQIQYAERTITKKDNFLIISTRSIHKRRNVNSIYFKKSWHKRIIKFDLVKGNILVCYVSSGGNNKFYTNEFQ